MSNQADKLLPQWDGPYPPPVGDLVDTGDDDVLAAFYRESGSPRVAGGWPTFLLDFYELDLSPANLPAVAEFVRRGLPAGLQGFVDDDFLLFCNWPLTWSVRGRAALYVEPHAPFRPVDPASTDLVRAFNRDVWESSVEPGFQKAPEDRRPLEVALHDQDGAMYYWMPLTPETAMQLMRHNQAALRRVFDALLLEASRSDLSAALSESQNGAPVVQEARSALKSVDWFAGNTSHSQRRLVVLLGAVGFETFRVTKIMLDCLPNSVTWAWDQLAAAVDRSDTYTRCAHPKCQKLFKKENSRQDHCSPKCANAHKQHRYRARRGSQGGQQHGDAGQTPRQHKEK